MNDIITSLLVAVLSAFGAGPSNDLPPEPAVTAVAVTCAVAREGGALLATASAETPVAGAYLLEVSARSGHAVSRQKGSFRIVDDRADRLAVVRLGPDAAATLSLTWDGGSTTCSLP